MKSPLKLLIGLTLGLFLGASVYSHAQIVVSGTGSTAPGIVTSCGSSDTQVLFTDSTSCAGNAGLTFVKGSGTLSATAFSGPITASNATISTGGAVRPDTTTAHTMLIQGYDNDTGPAYVTFATITNGNSPSLVISPPAGGATINLTTTLITTSGSGMLVANVGANSCGTTAATIAGNSNAFEITVGATSGTQCRVAFPTAAPNQWDCVSDDNTTTLATRTTIIDTTHVDFLGAFVAGDKITGICFPR